MINSIQEYKSLVDKMNQASALYYKGETSGMSDADWDKSLIDVQAWERQYPDTILPNSPSQKVNEDDSFVEDGDKVNHKVPLLSLVDYFDKDSFVNWWKGQAEVGFSVEPKIDGLSVEVIYDKGELISGSTRGNGYVGIDATETIKNIAGIPKTIPYQELLAVRGEVYMTDEAFDRYNKTEGPARNARNLAVGLLKRQDGGQAAGKYLSCFVFNLQYGGPDGLTHMGTLDFMRQQGLPVIPSTYCNDLPQILAAIDRIQDERSGLGYRIDGAVIKYNDSTLRGQVGDNGVTPNWAVAFKYPAVECETPLLDITYQLGKSGKLTPVAILQPVDLDGSTVSRCTLHNLNRMKELDIRVGDLVTLHKSGDVIPKITSARHTENSQEFSYPAVCPQCGAPLEGEFCVNEGCPNKTESKLYNWVDKGGLDAKGVAGSLVYALIERKMISTPADFYKLTPADLYKLPKMGPTKVTKTLKALDETRKRGFAQCIVALCIDTIGWSAAEKLTKVIKSWDALASLTESECKSIVGQAAGEKLWKALQTNYYKQLIEDLKPLFIFKED